jgi:hypothetical protein
MKVKTATVQTLCYPFIFFRHEVSSDLISPTTSSAASACPKNITAIRDHLASRPPVNVGKLDALPDGQG